MHYAFVCHTLCSLQTSICTSLKNCSQYICSSSIQKEYSRIGGKSQRLMRVRPHAANGTMRTGRRLNIESEHLITTHIMI